MPNYGQGKIYSIRSHQCEDIYIGSTTQQLSKRLGDHRAKFKNHQNGKGCYVSSFEIIKYDNHYIELIESYPCTSRSELEREEGKHIRANKCVNKVVAGRTQKEYYQDHKEQKKQYYQDNREERLLKNKQYYQENKKQMKQYYQENKKKIKKYQKKQYNQNKKQKYTCVCGSTLTINNKSRHEKSKKHIKFINPI